MKNKTKKVIKTLCFSFLIISTITGSFAWFLSNRNLDVTTDTEITCEGGNTLDISMKKGDTWTPWQKRLSDNSLVAKLQDISGNGEKLFTPEDLIRDENNNLVPTDIGFSPSKMMDPVTGQGDYIEIEIKIRSMSYLDIYFSGDSSITPMILFSDPDFIGFHKDYIAGAMRVAVLERTVNTGTDGTETNNDALKMIWAPNPNYKLTHNEMTGEFSFIDNARYTSYEEFQYYVESGKTADGKQMYEPHVVPTDDFVSKKFVVGSTNATNKMINQSPIITTLDPNDPTKLVDNYAVSHLVFRIWFEGTDEEARLPLSGGHVKTKLTLVGNNAKEECTAPNKMLIDNIQFNENYTSKSYFLNLPDTSKKVEFSSTGFHWDTYTSLGTGSDNLPDILEVMKNNYANDNKVLNYNIYFKYPETEKNKEYIRKFEFTYDPIENNIKVTQNAQI